MTRGAVATLSFLVGALVTVVALLLFQRGQDPSRGQGKNEFAVLVVGDATGKCVLREPRPQNLFTTSSSTVTWIVAGSCAGAPEVKIDRNVRTEDGNRDIFATEGELKTTAEHGRTITARLQGNLTPDNEPELYEYAVLINGKPAEYASPAERGRLYACPYWPCSIDAF